MELSALTAATADIDRIRRTAICLYDAQAVESAIAGMAKQIAKATRTMRKQVVLVFIARGG